MLYLDNLNLWKNAKNLDIKLEIEFKQMSEKDLILSFLNDLEFGTAGLRGILGARNRKNKFIYY